MFFKIISRNFRVDIEKKAINIGPLTLSRFCIALTLHLPARQKAFR